MQGVCQNPEPLNFKGLSPYDYGYPQAGEFSGTHIPTKGWQNFPYVQGTCG